MRKGIMALEELDEVVVDVTPVDETPVEDPSTTVEADVAEMNESGDELEEVNEVLDARAEVAETIEAVADEVAESVPEGGVSEPEARALTTAVEHMCTSVGIRYSKKSIATEGFADKKTRAERTVALEAGFKETAKKIWESIVAWFKKAIEFVQTFFRGLFKASEGVKNRAISLGKKAAGSKGLSAAADAKLAPGSYAQKLTVKGQVVAAKDLAAAYAKLADDKFVNMDRSSIYSNAKVNLARAVEEKSSEPLKKFIEEFSKDGIQGVKTSDAQQNVFEYELPLGDVSFVSTQNATSGSITVALGTATKAPEYKAPESIEILTVDEAEANAKAVADHMDDYKDVITRSTKLTAGLNELLSRVKAVASKDGEGNIAKDVSKFVTAVNAITVRASTLLESYDINTSKAVLDYVAASLSKLPSKKKEEKAAAAA